MVELSIYIKREKKRERKREREDRKREKKQTDKQTEKNGKNQKITVEPRQLSTHYIRF